MWLLPSYSRPKKIEALIQLESTCLAPITLRLHDDDPMLEEYEKLKYPEEWTVIVGPSLRLGPTWNWALKEFPEEKCYGFIGDDCVPTPANWWKILEAAAEDWYIAYPDDGVHGANLCTHPCVGGNLLRQLGWWANPGLMHSFIDTSLFAIGLRLNLLRYVEEVKFDHQHPVRGEVAMDATYERGQESYQMDEYRFKKWIHSNIALMDVRRIEKKLPKVG